MSTLLGHHAIKRQTAGYAAFAIADVELEAISNSSEVLITQGSEWRSSVAFGVDYALALAKERRSFRVSVRLQATVIDSTPAVVALAVARAVLNALGRADGPLPDLEKQDRRVVFPHW